MRHFVSFVSAVYSTFRCYKFEKKILVGFFNPFCDLLADILPRLSTEEYNKDQETWIKSTKDILATLPPSHYRLLGYLTIYLGRYEAKHGRGAGVCGVFAPVILPHVPPATTLLRDILAAAPFLFPDW